jgi:hypothetical protein
MPEGNTVPGAGEYVNVPGTEDVANKPLAPGAIRPEICVADAVAFNCAELSGVPESMVPGAGHVMVGVNGHPGGVQEYGFCRFKVVIGADAPPWPVLLSLMLNVTLSGAVCAVAGEPSVVVNPVNPGLPAPGLCIPNA